jgi:uncharacterized protein
MQGFTGFEWDDANRSKCQKHGVSIEEIEAVFQGRLHVAPDPKHSDIEDRYIAIGRTGTGRPLFVIFAIRVRARERLIRPISARYMHAKEIRNYEAQNP